MERHEQLKAAEFIEIQVYDSADRAHVSQTLVLQLEAFAIIAFTDITQLRENEQRLKERDENLHHLISQPFTGMYVRDEKGFIFVNQRFCEIMGWREDELKGKGLKEIAGYDDKSNALIEQKWQEV